MHAPSRLWSCTCATSRQEKIFLLSMGGIGGFVDGFVDGFVHRTTPFTVCCSYCSTAVQHESAPHLYFYTISIIRSFVFFFFFVWLFSEAFV